MTKAKYLFKTFLILIIFFILNCAPNKQKYSVGKFDLSIEIPTSLEEVDKEIANKKLNEGINYISDSGLNANRNQKIIFDFKKGEFTSLYAKISQINNDVTLNYSNYWKSYKEIGYNVLKENFKDFANRIDSTSRIELINGSKFYVLEHNIYTKDANDNIAKFQSLRYSIPLDNHDLIIDASYLIPDSIYQYKDDRELIKNILNSIKIK